MSTCPRSSGRTGSPSAAVIRLGAPVGTVDTSRLPGGLRQRARVFVLYGKGPGRPDRHPGRAASPCRSCLCRGRCPIASWSASAGAGPEPALVNDSARVMPVRCRTTIAVALRGRSAPATGRVAVVGGGDRVLPGGIGAARRRALRDFAWPVTAAGAVCAGSVEFCAETVEVCRDRRLGAVGVTRAASPPAVRVRASGPASPCAPLRLRLRHCRRRFRGSASCL